MIKDAQPDTPYEDGLSPIIARDTLAKDLLLALLDEIKHLPDVWQKMSAMKQDDVIERLRRRVVYNVEAAVSIIAAGQRVTINGVLAQVTLKDGIKAVFEIPKDHPNRHQFMDCLGSSCMIVVADADALTGDVDSVKGESDQQSFFDDRGKREVGDPVGNDVTGKSNVHPLTGISFKPDEDDSIVDAEFTEGNNNPPLQPGDDGYVAPLTDENELRDALNDLDDADLNKAVGDIIDNATASSEVNPLDDGLPPAETDAKPKLKPRGKKPKDTDPAPATDDDF